MRAAAFALLAVSLAGCRSSGDAPRETPWASAPIEAWPSADHVMCVDLDRNGDELVAGASGNDLWIAAPELTGARVRFRASFDAPVQKVTAGDFGRGFHLYVARGDEHKKGTSPVIVSEVDVASAAVTDLFRIETVRPEVIQLEVADVDRDEKPDLAFACYATKNQVKTHHLRGDGRVVEGALDRTAQAQTFGDLDGDGVDDAVVGRLYGEGEGASSGDLEVDLGKGAIAIPTEGGVRAVAIGKEGGKNVLYFADGWSSAYLKEGKARLKRARWNGSTFDVDTLGASPDEYTFFSLRAVGGAVVAAGNARVTLLGTKVQPLGGPGKGVTAACRAKNGDFDVWAPGASVAILPKL